MSGQQDAEVHNTRAARRLARIIGAIKIILLGLVTIVYLFALLSATELSLVNVVAGAFSLLSIYVLFGWFEQTLLMLILIAEHTSAAPEVTLQS